MNTNRCAFYKRTGLEILKFYFENVENLSTETFDEKIENLEKKLITEALESRNSLRKTAKDLGITHTKLINRMKKYKIKNKE